MDDPSDFTTLLRDFIRRERRTSMNLAQMLGLSINTLRNWTGGRVQHPRFVTDILKLARALTLDETDTTRLLTAAGHPSLSALQVQIQQSNDPDLTALLTFWSHSDVQQAPGAASTLPARYQLRPPVADFVGREAEAEQLIGTFDNGLAQGQGALISAVQGMGSVGKTELAYLVAHRLRNTFPDAQIVVNLRGSSTSPLTPAQALQAVIHAFAPDAKLPEELAKLEQHYRSVLHNQRALILADDASDATQVHSLIPPSGSALLITSRQRFLLPGMATVHLEHLTQAEAVTLLRSICPRLSTDEAEAIGRACGYLPLALRVSGEQLANSSISVSQATRQDPTATISSAQTNPSALPHPIATAGSARSFLYASLTAGLAGLPGNPLAGVEQFLHEYLGTPEAPASFGGREVQLVELDHWLVNPAHPTALLVAPAGRGKSALLTQWIARVAAERRAAVVFLPVSIRFGTARKSTSLGILGARLRALHNVQADLPREPEFWLTEIDHYLRADHAADIPLLLVLDGADEAIDWVCGRDLRFSPHLGRGVKVLVSARELVDCDAAEWLHRLEWDHTGQRLALPLMDRRDMAAVLIALGDPLRKLAAQVDIVAELYRLSDGDPLLVRLYIDALRSTGGRAAFLQPADLRHLEPGLAAYCECWWEEQREQWGLATPLREPTVRTLLNLFACALGPLSMADLLALTRHEGFDSWILDEALRPLARFVIGAEEAGGYVFSHLRLHQYFYDKLTRRERKEWEQRFVTLGGDVLAALDAGRILPQEVSPYIVRFYSTHLERTAADSQRFFDLVSKGWLRAWEALEGGYDGFLGEVNRAWQRADGADRAEHNRSLLPEMIGRQCRYALIKASVHSLSYNIPPVLLEALVATKIWTIEQAFAVVRNIPDQRIWAQAITRLTAYLPEFLLREAVEKASVYASSGSPVAQAPGKDALKTLMPQLAVLGYPEEAVSRVWAFEDPWLKTALLKCVAPHLSAAARQQALSAVLSLPEQDPLAWGLIDLLPHLAMSQIHVVIQTAQTALEDIERAKVFVALIPFLPDSERKPIVDQVINTVRAVMRHASIEILRQLLPYVPDIVRATLVDEALSVARLWEQAGSRAYELSLLIPFLSDEMQQTVVQEVLSAIDAEDLRASRMRHLGYLLDAIPERFRPFVIEKLRTAFLALSYRDQESVAQNNGSTVISHLITDLPIDEVHTLIAQLRSERLRKVMLTRLAIEYAKRGVYQEAFALVRTVQQAEIIVGILPFLPGSQMRNVLTIARLFEQRSEQIAALAELAPYLSGETESLLREALILAQSIGDDGQQASTIRILEDYDYQVAAVQREVERLPMGYVLALPQTRRLERLAAILIAVRAISDSEKRARALEHIEYHLLYPDEVMAVLESIRTINDVRLRAERVYKLAKRTLQIGYPEDALMIMQVEMSLEERDSRENPGVSDSFDDDSGLDKPTVAQVWLNSKLSATERSTMLADALAMAAGATPDRRLEMLREIIPQLTRLDQIAYVFDVARTINQDDGYDDRISQLVQRLVCLGHAEEAFRMIEEHMQSKSATFGKTTVPSWGALTLARQGYTDLAQAAARLIDDTEWRATVLAHIAAYCGGAEQAALLEEAQTALQLIDPPTNQSSVLAALAHTLGVLGYVQEAIDLAERIDLPGNAAEAMAILIPFLSESIRAEVFHRALTCYNRDTSFFYPEHFVYHVGSYLKHVPQNEQPTLWCTTLHLLALSRRDQLLSGLDRLTPVIASLGGQAALTAVAQAIVEVGHWFP